MLKFLTAKWQDLIIANYDIDPALLSGLVPAGTELDLNEGKCFVSFVAFMFRDTRVLGVPVPFHVNFEEVNLRFYVRRSVGDETRRGVVFIKEIVPRWAIAFVARTLYGEPYEAWKMSHSADANEFTYSFERSSRSNSIRSVISENLGVPDEDSHGSFIIEHYWGYTRRSATRTEEYKVEHPKWELFSVNEYAIEVDFEDTYGERFAFLNSSQPYSVVYAQGSSVAVYKGQTIK